MLKFKFKARPFLPLPIWFGSKKVWPCPWPEVDNWGSFFDNFFLHSNVSLNGQRLWLSSRADVPISWVRIWSDSRLFFFFHFLVNLCLKKWGTYLCCLGQRWLNTEWYHCIWGCTIALYIFDMKTEVVESKCENFCSIEQKVWTSQNFYLGMFKLCTAAVDSRTLANASTTRQLTVLFEAQTSKITFFFLGNLELPRPLRQV